jgi:hypothetical protein
LFFVICTPRLRQRIEAGLTPALKDCLSNTRLMELQQGLEKVRSNAPDKTIYEPLTNIAFEFAHIWAKTKASPQCSLALLLYSGTMDEALLPFMKREQLIRNAMKAWQQDKEYYQMLVTLSNPLGIIPAVYDLRGPNQKQILQDYDVYLDRFQKTIQLAAPPQ